MYTKCPSCRAEISFEPPANAASLPDGYKHKIKCPSCGVTIGVKIPRWESDAVQPTFTPANPNATPSETVFAAQPVTAPVEAVDFKKAKKSGGRGKSFTMMFFSILLVVVSCLGYLVTKGTLGVELLSGLSIFDGITPIELLIKDAAGFFADIPVAIIMLLPTIMLVFAGITAIVGIIATFMDKYSRVFNFLFGLIAGGAAICSLLKGVLLGAAVGVSVDFAEYFKAIIDGEQYLAFVGAGLGLITLVLAFAFIFGKKKAKAE